LTLWTRSWFLGENGFSTTRSLFRIIHFGVRFENLRSVCSMREDLMLPFPGVHPSIIALWHCSERGDKRLVV